MQHRLPRGELVLVRDRRPVRCRAPEPEPPIRPLGQSCQPTGSLRDGPSKQRLGGGSKQKVTELSFGARLLVMNAHVDHILDEALGLPPDERSALTVALLDSLEGSDDSSIAEAWRQEIRARQAALRAGTVNAVSWTEARARLSAL